MNDDMLGAYLAVVDAIANDDRPMVAYSSVESAIATLLDQALTTILVLRDGGEVERVHSSMPGPYPVGGRKAMGRTPWGDLVLVGKQSFIGRDRPAMRWAFPDYELSESLGLGSIINVPVLHGGIVLGTLNVTGKEGAYTTEAQADIVRAFTPFLIPPLTAARSDR